MANMKYMTADEVGERWKCSGHHVRNKIHSGEISGVKLGKAWCIRTDEVCRYEKLKEKADMERLRQERIGFCG